MGYHKEILDLIYEPVCFVNRRYEIVSANKAFFMSFASKETNIKGFSLKNIFGEEIFNNLIKPDFDLCLTGEKLSKKYLDFIDPYANERKMYAEYYVYHDIENELDGVFIIFNKSPEEKALMPDTKFKALLENAPDGVAIINTQGFFKYASPQALRIFGYKADDFIGHSGQEFTHPEDLAKVFSIFNELIANPSKVISHEYRFKNKYGTYTWIETTFKNMVHDELIRGFILNFTDVSERRLSHQKLKQSEEKFRRFVESANDIIYQLDPQGNFTYLSPNLPDILGYETEELVGKAIRRIIHPDDFTKFKSFLDEVLATAEKKSGIEYRIKHKNGNWEWHLSNGSPLLNLKNEVYSYLGIARDINERKEFEKKLMQQNLEYEHLNEQLKKTNKELLLAKENAENASKLKTEFLQNLSHEIRTPMNGIMGFSQLLDDDSLSKEDRKYYSDIVLSSSEQLLRIIDDILEISTLETKQDDLNETEFCLNDFLMELFSIFNQNSKQNKIPLYIIKELADDKSYIRSDKSKLNKILSNLLENALKFTEEGYVELGYFIENESLILYVKDTGKGISKQAQSKIFERFAQENNEIASSFGGLGLGLSISKENAELLGGRIGLESEPGKGSTFFVRIPYKPTSPIIEEKKSDAFFENTAVSNKYTILVAEDEHVNYMYIETLFEKEIDGVYTLIHAKNGKEAVDICYDNNEIDIVLMDIKMPVMNGHRATVKIKTKYPDLPVIAQTAYSTESEKQKALNSGCDDFIPKPIEKEKLLNMINTYLKQF
jgi:PAS domain S-box-containing protein